MRRGVAIAAIALLLAGCAPAPTPIPPGPTEAEAEALAAQQQQRMWGVNVARYPAQFDRPDPNLSVVAYLPESQWAPTVASCLAEAGFGSTIDHGAISPVFQPGQLEGEFAYAEYVCETQYPYPPTKRGFLSRAQLEYMYAFYTQRLSPCLRLMGYTVSDAPPEKAFVEGYETTFFFGWNPYEEVAPYVNNERVWANIDWRCGSLPDPFPAFH